MHWLAVGEHTIPGGTDWLAPAEAARAATMRFTKRRTEYRLRRLAGKRAVAAVLGRPVDAVSLAGIGVLNRRGGAPYVVVDGAEVPLDVSLTDRAGWAVCLVGPSGELAGGTLGVDLEAVEPRSRGFVSDYLTASEQEYVYGCGDPGSEGWNVASNLLWSAKESALKVLRVGLRADTRWVEVSLDEHPRPDGWSALVVHTRGGELFPGWWRRDGHFLLTLASRESTEPPALLPDGDDLASGEPVHSWLDRPLAN
ncbi:MAG: 4'-phosphopantetheinyl transferase superfamily protein [Candidatus Phosphoribacter sp.]